MEITKKFFCSLLVLMPIFLVTGPAIPDIVISSASIFFLSVVFFNKHENKIIKFTWFKISLLFWIFLIISSFFAYDFFTSFTETLIFFRLLLIPALILYILFGKKSKIGDR